MRKICIIAEQSIICNNYKTGIGEFVDGLAISLTDAFDVSVITASERPSFAFNFTDKIKKETKDWVLAQVMGVNYYILKNNFNKLTLLLALIRPNLIQLVDFDIDNLPPRIPTVYTIDEHLPKNQYTHIVVHSADHGQKYNCVGLDQGVLTEFFNPASGLFIPQKYDVNDLSGKAYCKEAFCKQYNLDIEKPLYMYLGRINKKKGAQYFPGLADEIAKNNGYFVCMGKTDKEFENENILHFNANASITTTLSYLAAADFYISCSVEDIGPLMPRHAACYGTIPITTPIMGMRTIFNDENAIVYTDATETIEKSIELYNNKEKLNQKRITCMSWDFSWQSKIQAWIDFYNSVIK